MEYGGVFSLIRSFLKKTLTLSYTFEKEVSNVISGKRLQIAKQLLDEFLKDKEFYPTIDAINQGGCADFADLLNREYKKNGLSEHRFCSTFDFISSEASSYCEYMKDWNEEEMIKLGVPSGYFFRYKKVVEERDAYGTIGYHVWLYDGEQHYDATCLEGVKNPLELPFFKLFLNGGSLI